MDWKVLGIEPTKDISAIEAAYNEKLQQIDMENRPEDFTALKSAYDEAIVFARDLVQREPVGSTRGFKVLFPVFYRKFDLRREPAEWDAFLTQEETVYGREQTMFLVLDELMEKHILPAAVWQFLEQRYHFSEKKDMLFDKYPMQYITEVILKGPSQTDLLPFDLFVPGKDGSVCDEYIKLYYLALGLRPDQTKDTFEKLNAMSEQHPYGKALEARNRVITGDESALQVLEAICGKYPGHKELQMELAVSYMATARTGKCEEICRGVLESDPADFSANVLLSQAVASQGRYREASDLLTSLIKDPSVDTSVVGRLSAMRAEYNVQVIRDHEEAEAAGRKDDAELLDHAWRCLQNNMIEEADEIASKIDAGNVDGTELTDLMNQIWFVTGNRERATASADALIAAAKKDPSLAYRLPEFYARKANVLYTSGRRSEAADTYRAALDDCGNDRNILSMLCRILLSSRDYSGTSVYAKRMIDAYPGSHLGHYLLAEALYGEGDVRAASAEADAALKLNSSDLELLVLKIRLLIESRALEDAEMILQSLIRGGAEDVTAVKWCSALIKEMKYHRDDEALDDYFDIAERLESGEYLSWAAKVYYRIAAVMGAQIESSDTEGMQRVRDAVNKGLAIDPQDRDLLKYLDMLDGKNAEGLTLAD